MGDGNGILQERVQVRKEVQTGWVLHDLYRYHFGLWLSIEIVCKYQFYDEVIAKYSKEFKSDKLCKLS